MADAPETHDQCDECGFDGAQWSNQDTINSIRRAPELLRQWSAHLSAEQLNARPEPEVWSVTEYIDHLRSTFFGMRFMVELACDSPGFDLGDAPPTDPPGAPRVLDHEACLDGVRIETDALCASLVSLDPDLWDNSVVLDGNRRSITWASRHGLHDLWHHLTDFAAITVSLGAGVSTQEGTVAQISRSDGGVPKALAAEAQVDRSGVVGDSQRLSQHGGPWQALSLWSTEVIAGLVEDGHPIYPGATGENLTISGLDWSTVHPGVVITIGALVCRISGPAAVGSKNNQWFADHTSQHVAFDRHPERARWYAAVLTPGRVVIGDEVVMTSDLAT